MGKFSSIRSFLYTSRPGLYLLIFYWFPFTSCICGSTEPRSSPNSKILWYKFLSKYYLHRSGNFYPNFMAMGLLESGPLIKFGATGGPWEAPCRPPRHSKKVNFKSKVTHLQEVIKNFYGKGLGLWAGPWGPKGGSHQTHESPPPPWYEHAHRFNGFLGPFPLPEY